MHRYLHGEFWISLFITPKITKHCQQSQKKNNFCHVFRCKMFYKSGSEWVINNPLCKYLQNVVRNTTGKFGVCQCCWSGNLSLREWEKTAFKDLHCKTLFFQAMINWSHSLNIKLQKTCNTKNVCLYVSNQLEKFHGDIY